MIRTLQRMFVATVLVASALAVSASPAQAVPLTITVTINQVSECCGGNIDAGHGADFYAKVWIEGVKTEFGVFADDEDVVTPDDWVATGTVEHTEPYADVTIEIWDEEEVWESDTLVDMSTGPQGGTKGVDLFLRLGLADKDCDFSGDAYGDCNARTRSFGNEGSEVGEVFFTIGVSEPPQAPGLHVGCVHAPLWPQPGDNVTLTASVFGDQPDGSALPAKRADTIEIWFSTDGGVTKQKATTTSRQQVFTNGRVAGAAGSTFSYGCRVLDGGSRISSGWRSVQVGNPPQGQAIPVMLSNSRERALDVVLFAGTANMRRDPLNAGDTNLLTYPVYTGVNDPAFRAHAGEMLAELQAEQVVLDNQRYINLWLALDPAATGGFRDLFTDADGDGAADDVATDTSGDGRPDGNGIDETCQVQTPANLGTAYGFANARGILHPATPNPPGNFNTLRECAVNGVFTAERTEAGVFMHELGHAGWGLADEYCCNGGYRQPNPFPNTYLSLQACQDDVESLGGVDADCRGQDRAQDTDANPDFWVSDPVSNDMMNDNAFARRADRRRMSYVFGLCAQGTSC